MTDDELNEIERVWSEATKGPWRIERATFGGNYTKLYSVSPPNMHDAYLLDLSDGDANEQANFNAIGRAAQDVAALLAEVRRLRDALRPFAEAGQRWLPVDATDTSSVWVSTLDTAELGRLSPRCPLTVGHLRKAARAMPDSD